jgi:hypothetical protein
MRAVAGVFVVTFGLLGAVQVAAPTISISPDNCPDGTHRPSYDIYRSKTSVGT